MEPAPTLVNGGYRQKSIGPAIASLSSTLNPFYANRKADQGLAPAAKQPSAKRPHAVTETMRARKDNEAVPSPSFKSRRYAPNFQRALASTLSTCVVRLSLRQHRIQLKSREESGGDA